jgi:hypothetical protein
MPAPYDDDPRYDDHDTDRPRPKKKGGASLYFLLALGVLLVGGLIFALIYFLGGSNNYDSEMAAYLPAETNMMVGVEVEELMKNDKVKNLVTTVFQGEGKEFYAKLKEAGMDENSFTRVLVGGDMGGAMFGAGPGAGKEPNMVGVIRAKKAFDKAKIAQLMSLTEQTKNGKTFYKSDKKKDIFVHYPSDMMAVIASSEKAMDGVLSRGDGKVVISEDMQELAKKLSKGQVWVAVGTAAFEKELKQAEHLEDMGVPADIANAVKGMRGVGFYAKLDGDKLTFAGGVLCADRSTASRAADALQKEINDKVRGKSIDQLPLPFPGAKGEGGDEFKKLITDIQQSAKADNSGALLEVSASCSVSGLEALFKGFMMPVERQRVQQAPVRVEAHEEAAPNRPQNKENRNELPKFGKQGIPVPAPMPAPTDAPEKK